MRSLQNLLLALCMCVRSAAEEIRVSGHERGEVHVSCPYSPGYESYEKYLCKNKCLNDVDVLIKTTEPNQNKYSIHDDKRKRVFTATISDLRRTDARRYWCGVTRPGKDIYTEVLLEVGPAWCCVRSDEASGIVGRPLTVRCPYPPPHGANRKFLCKGDHRNNCTGVATSGGRFSLRDDAPSGSFLVIITELEAGDAGTYWCGSDSQWTVGNYTNIHLSASAVSPSVVFIVPAVLVPAVLLTLTFALVMVCKYRCNKARGAGAASGNRNVIKAAEKEGAMAGADISENQEVAHFLARSWGPQSAAPYCVDVEDAPYYVDVEDAQQESLYQNFTSDDIYSN